MASVSETSYPIDSYPESNRVTSNTLYGRDLISIQDLTLDDIHLILETTKQFKALEHSDSQGSPNIESHSSLKQALKNKVIAHCFFEPSTRTRLSFEAATVKLSGSTIGFSSSEGLSIQKGESLSDTIRVVSDYADLIVIRHPKEGSARLAADISLKPVINAGDGGNQHPTQALIDLFTIQESQGNLNKLSIALIGDLKYSRTIHSFVQVCLHFNVRLFLIAHDAFTLPESICDALKNNGIRFSFHRTIEEVIDKVDILYMTRLQKERFTETEITFAKKGYFITPEILKNAKPNLKILHPLPRIDEIDTRVDQTPYAHFFEQAANGVYVRQAILNLILNKGQA